jgi:hypothetical protein
MLPGAQIVNIWDLNMNSSIIATMSQRRFDTYLHAAGYDRDRAIKLYLWNAKLGASFHIPIQTLEIGLRNRINHALSEEFGLNWWKNPKFSNIIDREREHDLSTVKARIIRKKLNLETGQIVAGLSFGFWVGMLQPKYNPMIWSKQLRTSFPKLPATESRQSLFKYCGKIANFRNRISHHEPLLRADAMGIYGEIMTVLQWICPPTTVWVRPHCEVPKIIRLKP